jgi:hypothetical protein
VEIFSKENMESKEFKFYSKSSRSVFSRLKIEFMKNHKSFKKDLWGPYVQQYLKDRSNKKFTSDGQRGQTQVQPEISENLIKKPQL